MNIFKEYQKKIHNCLKNLEKKNLLVAPISSQNITVELPPPNQSGDISCNVAMILAKHNKTSPMELAKTIKNQLQISFKEFKNIEIAKPGFLNIEFSILFWGKYLNQIVKLNKKYGVNDDKTQKFNIEFVSANPTGPLHVGHCRGAILGDSLSNLLIFNGNKVTKEYYVNDYGGQIKNYVLSVYYRILEIINKKEFPTDVSLYPGDYVIDIAKSIIKEKKITKFNNFNKISKKLTSETLRHSMKLIMSNLKLLGIKHDNFVFESSIINKKIVLNVIKKLKKKKFIYEGQLEPPKGEPNQNWKARKQLLFKSTLFGDDIDRSLQKADGSWTYFAGDMAYHFNKVSRKFNVLINILGADHAGYIKRIVSATKAISDDKVNLICKVSQLVKLYKNSQPFKMSKRKGDYITVDDLIEEVGKDATRFIMLNRSSDVELDFDFDAVKEKSKDNPVFYVQYAHARVCSIFRILKLNLNKKIIIKADNLRLNTHEIKILKKISEWPKCIYISSKKFEPHRIPFFLYELSSLFHSYWSLGKDNKEFRFIENGKPVNQSKLILLQALSITIKNGMSILGVSTPEKM